MYYGLTKEQIYNKYIPMYRQLYPNDYFIEDDDLKQEIELQRLININKGRPQTYRMMEALQSSHENMSMDVTNNSLSIDSLDEYEQYDVTELDINEVACNNINKQGIRQFINWWYTTFKCSGTFARNMYILEYRFGFITGKPETFESAANAVGLSRNRSYQIIPRMIVRLKNYKHIMNEFHIQSIK